MFCVNWAVFVYFYYHMPTVQQPVLPNANDFRSVARALTVVENDLPGATELLQNLDLSKQVPVIGITGPPGAGKSTLVNALITDLCTDGKKVAVLAIDPTSPFNYGSLLGDRIRMSGHFNHPDVFIRSLATRGSLGGLSAKTIEMSDVLRASGFDYVLIETVGVGQSEIEIAGLADITLLVLVPESGDEIQNIKSGIMEIADAFIINKADRDGADAYYNALRKLVNQKENTIPIYKTVASQNTGVNEISGYIKQIPLSNNKRREYLLTEKAWQLIREQRMAGVDKNVLKKQIAEVMQEPGFNLYQFLAPQPPEGGV
jgi:LAO/AO transport system kinase